jgi:hypothetical protein
MAPWIPPDVQQEASTPGKVVAKNNNQRRAQAKQGRQGRTDDGNARMT